MREKVAADVFKNAGVVVSHTAFYTLYLDHGNLYKPEDGSADFIEGTFSQNDFTKKTNEDAADWSDVENKP